MEHVVLLSFLPCFAFRTTAAQFHPETSFEINVLERLETCTGISIFKTLAPKCSELIGHSWLQPKWAHQSWHTLSPADRSQRVLERWPATWRMLFKVLEDLELGWLAQLMEDWLRMVPGRAVAGPEHSRGEEVEGEGRLKQTEGVAEEMGGAEGKEQEGGSEEDTKSGAGVKEEGGAAKWEGGAEKEPLKMKQEQDLVRMLEETVAKREEQLQQCEDTIQMYEERLQKQLQQMESVMSENEQLRKQIRPAEEGALVPARESTSIGKLNGCA